MQREILEPPAEPTPFFTNLSSSQNKKRRRPLEEIDLNVRSLRSATAAAVAAAAATRSCCPALLPRPLPSHVPVQGPRGAADTPDTAVYTDGHQPAAAAATSQSLRPRLDTDIDDSNPMPTPPGLSGLAAASLTVEPLDLGPMNVLTATPLIGLMSACLRHSLTTRNSKPVVSRATSC